MPGKHRTKIKGRSWGERICMLVLAEEKAMIAEKAARRGVSMTSLIVEAVDKLEVK
jgi:hypothetical protein